jgi:hypothetical protein
MALLSPRDFAFIRPIRPSIDSAHRSPLPSFSSSPVRGAFALSVDPSIQSTILRSSSFPVVVESLPLSVGAGIVVFLVSVFLHQLHQHARRRRTEQQLVVGAVSHRQVKEPLTDALE